LILTQEVGDEKQTLLKLRWYLLDSTIGDIVDIMDEEEASDRKPPTLEEDITLSLNLSASPALEFSNKLLDLMVQIIKTVKWYCKIVRLVIINQMKEAHKLVVYSEVQKKFTIACETISKNLACLEKATNQSFEEIFTEHPRYPRFSFWRMFMRIWATEVHAPLRDSLNKECLRIMSRISKENLKKATSPAEKPQSEESSR